ncbi:MAG: hypothetical protein Q7T63_03425 [Burkholderiaceae bacterium]|nr:hypothetical protein [Burkholderiaceae bacterium]MDO9088765.1 hypothetical protein [Burkholderiaceae bacterium]
MKYATWIPVAAILLVANGHAQSGNVYRCGTNEYTDNTAVAQARGCKLIDGGGVTVIHGTRVRPPASVATPATATPTVRVATASQSASGQAEQRARDADARAILESELRKAEARHAELQREYNKGEPEKLGPETRNHQKYLDRVAELKAALTRNESDIAGIKRELSRLPASK